jgi:hypothetical protein
VIRTQGFSCWCTAPLSVCAKIPLFRPPPASLSICRAQNAECVALFPAPLPRPGFYGRSLLEYSSCVPATACPGIDAVAVEELYSTLLQSGLPGAIQVHALVEEFFAAAGNFTANNTVVRCPRTPSNLLLLEAPPALRCCSSSCS